MYIVVYYIVYSCLYNCLLYICKIGVKYNIFLLYTLLLLITIIYYILS